jgi:hypothetical protein
VGIVATLHVGEGSGYIRELVVRLDFGWKVCGGEAVERFVVKVC